MEFTIGDWWFPAANCSLRVQSAIANRQLRKPPASRQILQVPPAGAHGGRFDREPALAVAKDENFCSDRLEPHWGQRGASWLLLRTSFSKTNPHTGQAYSKIGMGYLGGSLDLIAQLAGSSFPDGEERRADHVKREIPGMRGRTKNQRIRNPA